MTRLYIYCNVDGISTNSSSIPAFFYTSISIAAKTSIPIKIFAPVQAFVFTSTLATSLLKRYVKKTCKKPSS